MKTTSIKFGKTNLQNLKHHETVKQNDGKLLYNFPKKYFASNCQGLCLFVYPKPSVKKAFYAAWSIEKYDPKTGLSKRYGRYKYICDLGQKPLDWVIDHINQNLKQWKQEKQSTKSKRIDSKNAVIIKIIFPVYYKHTMVLIIYKMLTLYLI